MKRCLADGGRDLDHRPLCRPSSELHIETTWYRGTALEDLLGVSPEKVYAEGDPLTSSPSKLTLPVTQLPKNPRKTRLCHRHHLTVSRKRRLRQGIPQPIRPR